MRKLSITALRTASPDASAREFLQACRYPSGAASRTGQAAQLRRAGQAPATTVRHLTPAARFVPAARPVLPARGHGQAHGCGHGDVTWTGATCTAPSGVRRSAPVVERDRAAAQDGAD